MARAQTFTWLPLDRWAEILGLNPLYFNSLYLDDPENPKEECSGLWQQTMHQNPQNVGREELATAIAEAEDQISSYVGFNLIPDWVCNEEVQLERANAPEQRAMRFNPRWEAKSLTTRRKHIISGGQRAVSGLALGTRVLREDLDEDDYYESASIRFTCPWPEEPEPCDPQPLIYPLCEYRVFYPGHGGDPLWEIKPIEVSISAGLLYVRFKSWQILKEIYTRGSFVKNELDASDDSIYLEEVDLYRVYNDDSVNATLVWGESLCTLCGGSGCPTCYNVQQTACIKVRNPRLGIFAYDPAEFADLAWTIVCARQGRQPERAFVSYYSGFQDSCDCPNYQMKGKLERAVAYFAAALLPRDVCDCSNVEQFINQWREDLAESGEGLSSYALDTRDLKNPFGTRRGAIEAWRIINSDPTLVVGGR